MAERIGAAAGQIGAGAEQEARDVEDETCRSHGREAAVSRLSARRGLVGDVTHGVVDVVPGSGISGAGRVAGSGHRGRRAGPDQFAK